MSGSTAIRSATALAVGSPASVTSTRTDSACDASASGGTRSSRTGLGIPPEPCARRTPFVPRSAIDARLFPAEGASLPSARTRSRIAWSRAAVVAPDGTSGVSSIPQSVTCAPGATWEGAPGSNARTWIAVACSITATAGPPDPTRTLSGSPHSTPWRASVIG
jgi:hypothetical protein